MSSTRPSSTAAITRLLGTRDRAPQHTTFTTPAWPSNGAFTTSTIFNDQWQYRVSQEFRLTSKGTSRLQWLGGLFYERVHDNW